MNFTTVPEIFTVLSSENNDGCCYLNAKVTVDQGQVQGQCQQISYYHDVNPTRENQMMTDPNLIDSQTTSRINVAIISFCVKKIKVTHTHDKLLFVDLEIVSFLDTLGCIVQFQFKKS